MGLCPSRRIIPRLAAWIIRVPARNVLAAAHCTDRDSPSLRVTRGQTSLSREVPYHTLTRAYIVVPAPFAKVPTHQSLGAHYVASPSSPAPRATPHPDLPLTEDARGAPGSTASHYTSLTMAFGARNRVTRPIRNSMYEVTDHRWARNPGKGPRRSCYTYVSPARALGWPRSDRRTA